MKMYSIDNALLTETPEIRIGDKVYPVDDRQKTVEKIIKLAPETSEDGKKDNVKMMRETFALAFGKEHSREIEDMNLPYPAYLRLFETVIAAITGETPEAVSKRFQNGGEDKPE